MLSWLDALLLDCLDALAAGVHNPFNSFSLSLFALNLSWWANITCKTDLTSSIYQRPNTLKAARFVSCFVYLRRLCMWPSRKRNTDTGSGNSTWLKDFSSISWTREGPHMSTQAARVIHWWCEMGSCSVFLQQDWSEVRAAGAHSSWQPERWTDSGIWWWTLEWESRLEKVKENSIW